MTQALLARRFLLSLYLLVHPPRPDEPPVDPGRFDGLPRPQLVGELRDMVYGFEFLSEDELALSLHVLPAARLRLRREDTTSRFLDMLGLSREVRIDQPEFDRRYLIQDISARDARALFNPRVRDMVEALEPFFALEMLDKELRVIKYAPLRQGYTPQHALEDLERLVSLHLETRRIDLPDAGLLKR